VIVVATAGAVAGWGVTRESSKPAAPPPPPPPPKPFHIIFPEGFTRKDMGDRVVAVAEIARRKRNANVRLNRTAYRAASARGVVPCFGRKARTNLEGFLFPATYEFLANTLSRSLVADQLKAFCANWSKVDLRYARSKNLTPYDVLTIASMIEKEAQVPEERKLVAAVIYNRLRNRMALGIDATLRYGLDIPPTKAIRQSQLDSASPYNTSKRAGLPPTPIANPGLASMKAAAHPAKKNYLYFIRRPDCRSHFFTASAREFDNYTRAGLQC
jgi:peptidoglycan lytic transglycosylase G